VLAEHALADDEALTRDTPPAEGRPVQGCMACATYRSEGRACPRHRVTPPGEEDQPSNPDSHEWLGMDR
jgi:hypothetical protein